MKSPPSPPLSIPEANTERILRYLSLSLVGILTVFLSVREIYGADIPFHLNAGRWILENFSFPDKDVFTYTANDHSYADLNWLYQVFMYGVYSLSGSIGLVLINALFVLASVFLLFKRTVATYSVFLPWIILIAVITISPALEIRPHSVSWLFLSLALYFLQQYYEGNKKIIRWLPIIMILWVNSHSLFILGLAVTGCYGVSIFLKKKELLKDFLIWFALALLVCFLNPYGWKGLAHPFEQFFLLQEGNIFKENIRELQNPFSITDYELSLKNLLTQWHFFDLFMLLTVVGLIRQFKKVKIHEWLIIIIFFYFAYSATKNIGYFVFAITPIISAGFSGLKINRHAFQTGIAFIVLSIFFILTIRTNAFYIHYRAMYRFGLGWSDSNLPVKACDFLIKNRLHGNILNQMDLGGYIAFATGQKASIDGRLEVMGEEMFKEQIGSVSPEAKIKLIEKYKPEIILFNYPATPDWISFFLNQADWRLVYVDGCTAVYLKNGYAPTLPALDSKAFIGTSPLFTDVQADEILKSKTASFLSPLFTKQYYPVQELNKTFFCFHYGWVDAAKQVTLEGIKKASFISAESYQNLGTIYFEQKDRDRALHCYEKYLEETKNEAVEKRVKFLKGL